MSSKSGLCSTLVSALLYSVFCYIWLHNTLRPRQNGRHFADDIFKCISLNENVWILLKISLRFAPGVQINNIPALVQIMAWCWPGTKPLSEPAMECLLMHMCATRPQWVNNSLIVYHKMSQDLSANCLKPKSISVWWFMWLRKLGL